jgi:hypothetical protein
MARPGKINLPDGNGLVSKLDDGKLSTLENWE